MTGLQAGTRLGPYEIAGQIGAGGMGEVYKATDTRLERMVAIKLLPRHWADNAEMRKRFEREAQIIASLKHPNICVLHDIGKQDAHDFLVMEYLEGETLAARLERGGMGWEEALQVAIPMADALDKAHRQGVIHRDLKPSNVILCEGGPKLLDFGLAKWKGVKEPASAPTSASQIPTRTDVTTPGSLMGTLQYMAPEQLEGTEADARTDIFAFGAVLYEAITGKKAFTGKSRVLLMSAIASSEPEALTATNPDTPRALEHVLKVCLAKDPQERWQTARDLLAELQWCAETGADAGGTATPAAHGKQARISILALAAAGLAVLAMAVPAGLYLRGPGDEQEFRFRMQISTNARPANLAPETRDRAGRDFSISPDGRKLAFVTRVNPTEPWSLFVRPIGSVAPQRLAGAEDATLPFWSADSRSIGFVVSGKLKKVDASGGPPQEICDAAGFTGGAWNRDGTILFGTPAGVFRVSAQGGKPEAVTTVEQGEAGHFWPHFLPDGRHFLYTAWNGQPGKRAIFAASLGSKDKTRVAEADSNAGYAKPGYLLFHREAAVYAQPFDADDLKLSGEPVRVADEVAFTTQNGRGHFSVAEGGALVYYQTVSTGNASGAQSDLSEWQLTWIGRTGQSIESPGPSAPYRGFEVSPDGKRIAVHRHEANGGDVFVIEPRGSLTRLTFDASRHNSAPVWSPDGTRVVYSSLQKGKWGLYQTLSSGSGTEELLYESEVLKAPVSWSPDSKRIVFWVQDPKTEGDLWVLTLEGEKKAEPLIATPFEEKHGQISPDGKWIAYTSNSTGRHEVYVRPFPSGSGIYQISFHGGDWPRWRRDGKELFYHGIASSQDAPAQTNAFANGPLLSAAIAASGASFEPGSPKDIVRMPAVNLPHSGGSYQTYAVSADGQRILMMQYAPGAGVFTGVLGPEPASVFTVALNWASSLKK